MSRFNETMYAAFAENNVIPPAYFDTNFSSNYFNSLMKN